MRLRHWVGDNPRGDWRDWLLTYGWQTAFPDFEPGNSKDEVREGTFGNPKFGIPVFWKGSLDSNKAPGKQSFWFSLSRVMRVPFATSVGEVAQRLYGSGAYKVPRLDEPRGWDFSRALFGEVDHANDGSIEEVVPERQDNTVAEDALKGRVAFGFAWAKGTPKLGEVKHGVLGRPRESFWPFYLRAQSDHSRSVSYNSEDAIPAGRKRTHARRVPLPSLPQGNENEKTTSTMQFLSAGAVFQSEVRAHNLHPVEFGALLWALSFGDLSGAHWHQAGRAKGYGFGALSPQIRIKGTPTVVNAAADAVADPKTWVAAFEKYMSDRLGEPFAESSAVRSLRALADPISERDGRDLICAELKEYTAFSKIDAKRAASGDASIAYPLRDL